MMREHSRRSEQIVALTPSKSVVFKLDRRYIN